MSLVMCVTVLAMMATMNIMAFSLYAKTTVELPRGLQSLDPASVTVRTYLIENYSLHLQVFKVIVQRTATPLV